MSIQPVKMSYSDAIKAANEGEKVTRLDWLDSELCVLSRNGVLKERVPTFPPSYFPWSPTSEDESATDWVIVEEPISPSATAIRGKKSANS